MENDKKYKISLTVLILIIVVIVALIGIILFTSIKYLKERKNRIENTDTSSKTSQKSGNSNSSNKGYSTDLTSDFTFSFLKMENNKENIIYSPLSIKYALKMLEEGSNGNTKAQIENVIKDEKIPEYSNVEDVLSLANGLYIRDTYKDLVKDEYIDTLENKYNAEVKFDSFKSARNVNNWIEEKTFRQIKNMLSDESVSDTDSEMILINALAIDMEWKNKFDGENTHGRDFYLNDGKKINSTMMNMEDKSENISYYKDDDVTAVSINSEEYEGNEMEFIAIMPNEEKLDSYIENFDSNTFNNITNNFTKAEDTKNGVDLSIPRFSFDYDLDLKNDLIELGITDAFLENFADFSNMADRELYVSDALHKANIDFTEKGVKAAAVTVIMMQDLAALEEERPIEITINKPFMYIIRDKNNGEIWFVGSVYEPNHWEDDRNDYEYR